ncbi:CCR4-NOT transcription complex subunit 10-like [Iris pallida]|uniref:CCR4-NOT transcription complex subunit 10-like n=1 Tax=Iris pallida TaxID=29817 RepID=A0AAX6EUR9_IRIPA|nr:CCR4-NOT transcription complex subunit 10-like [Iris pallida]
MEGRDSSGEDGRTPTPATDGLAKEAEALFRSGRFAECVEVLNRLLAKKDGDPKVLHNIIVAEYFHEGCYDPRALLDRLEKVKKRTEELACTSGEQVENIIGTKATSGSIGSGTTLHQSSAAETGCIAYAVDTSIITLNTAILLYQLHEYKHALSILEPLYRNIDPIYEPTALHVCLLILDIALASNDASKAADVIQYLEKYFGVGYTNQIDNGSNSQHQSSNQGMKASTISNISAPDASNSDSNASANITENSLSGTLLDDALEYENLYSTLDGGGPNLGRPSSNDVAKAVTDRGAPVTELKLKLHLYKVRLLLLTRNLKAAKREIKLAVNMARGRDSSSELLLKSQLEYARGNHRKADKLLTTNSNMTEMPMPSIFNNNLGCIYYHLKCPHTSGIFFSKALRHSQSLRSEKPLKLSTFSQDKSFHITYNCGIQSLSCGNPLVAAKCFGKASKIFHNWPVLWLRLAECCFLELEKGPLRTSSEEVKVHVVGSGRWRHLVVEDLKPKDGYSTQENSDKFKLSLPFARYCLQNALILLYKDDQNARKFVVPSAFVEEEDHNQGKLAKGFSQKNTSTAGGSKAPKATPPSVPVDSNGDSKESKGAMSSNSTLQSAVATYEDALKEEKHMIRQTVLGALAYVELSLENHARALLHAESLIALPECSKIFVFLGHVYAAEALCHLNRLQEAADHLLVYLSDVNRVELPYSNEDRDEWSVKKGGGDGDDLNSSSTQPPPKTANDSRGGLILTPEEARGATYVNLSTMFALQGDLERACRFAAEARSLLPKDSRALLATVYLDLVQGKKTEPLSKLKQFSRVCYL